MSTETLTEEQQTLSPDDRVKVDKIKENKTVGELFNRFGEAQFQIQPTVDDIPTLWVPRDQVHDVAGYLKAQIDKPYRMLFDITAIDERLRKHRPGQPDNEFTTVYHLISPDRNEDIRLKVALQDDDLQVDSLTDLWPAANWYEREVWDMFGVGFNNHPNLTRILSPPMWEGHPLRKEHPTRATEMPDF